MVKYRVSLLCLILALFCAPVMAQEGVSSWTPGAVVGNGEATRVAFWSDAVTLTYDSNFYYDTATDTLPG